jgi:hypothetical protein
MLLTVRSGMSTNGSRRARLARTIDSPSAPICARVRWSRSFAPPRRADRAAGRFRAGPAVDRPLDLDAPVAFEVFKVVVLFPLVFFAAVVVAAVFFADVFLTFFFTRIFFFFRVMAGYT